METIIQALSDKIDKKYVLENVSDTDIEDLNSDSDYSEESSSSDSDDISEDLSESSDSSGPLRKRSNKM